jgi:hypothetical protein
MKTNEFLNLLKENTNKELVFEYQDGKFVNPSYHLTEIKNVNFETVDCGGTPNKWRETQIQVWESPQSTREYLRTEKAISIFERVNSIQPLWLDTELKVEFGNGDFHTSVMKVAGFQANETRLNIQLFEEKTACKAISKPLTKNEKTNECSPNMSCC